MNKKIIFPVPPKIELSILINTVIGLGRPAISKTLMKARS